MKNRFLKLVLVLTITVLHSDIVIYGNPIDSTIKTTQNISFGAKVGISFSDVVSSSPVGIIYALNNSSDSKLLRGFTAGLSFNSPINKRFSIQADVMYNQLGIVEFVTLNDNNTVYYKVQSTTHLHYLQLPVLLRLGKAEKVKRITPFFELGGSIGSLVSSYANLVPTDNETRFRDTTIEYSTIEKFDAGLIGGVGFEYPYSSTTSITLGLRYYYGLTSILSISVPFNITFARVFYHNRSFSVCLGVNF